MQLFLLYETASGYCLFEQEEYDATGGSMSKVMKAVNSLERFTKMVTLKAFQPFTTAEEALDNIMCTIDVKVSDQLKAFLTANLPATKSSKKQKFALGISEPHLGKPIFEATGITASFNETIVEQLDKDINTFCMRLKEWFSWHFPELMKIVNDNRIFTELVHALEHRENFTDENKDKIIAIVLDEEKATQVLEAAKTSMGTEMNETDVL